MIYIYVLSDLENNGVHHLFAEWEDVVASLTQKERNWYKSLKKGEQSALRRRISRIYWGDMYKVLTLLGIFFAGYWCGTPIFMIIVQMQIFEHLE